jgi:hypothetical protein
MRARIRLSFPLFCGLIFLLGTFASLQAQIHGTAPSVTSIGFGPGINPPGVPASVTSLGPNGFAPGFNNCCVSPFFISRPPLAIDARRLHHHHQFNNITGPIYVPYAVPYPVPYDDTGDYGSAEVDSASSRAVPAVHDRGATYRDEALATRPHRTFADPDPKPAALPVASDIPEPMVAAQPATVLIFKNGQQSEVLNYAIVGDTLFDFTDGRSHKIPLSDLDLPATQKANDDRGVDFRIPPKTTS